MVRVRAKIEKNTLFGKALVMVRAKIEKNTLFVGLLLGYEGQSKITEPYLITF